MGTITPRKRPDGTTGYTAQIRLKRGGKVIHTEAQTFDRKPAATVWLKKREGELAKPGALDRINVEDPTLAEVIDRYISESVKALGRTKEQVLSRYNGGRDNEFWLEAWNGKSCHGGPRTWQ